MRGIIASLALLGAPAVAVDGARRLSTILSAAAVPGGGDADGTALLGLTVDPAAGRVCYRLRATGLDASTAVHLHRAREGEAGPVVVALPAARGSGCVTVPTDQARAMLHAPPEFYADIHTAAHPSGAVRGQFSN